MYVLWDDIYDIYKRENCQVMDSPFISYFSGFLLMVWKELYTCWYRRKDCSETGMYPCIEQQWWEQRNAFDFGKQNDETSVSFILESHHIHGMK